MTEFYKNATYADGLVSSCKECTKRSQAEYATSPRGRDAIASYHQTPKYKDYMNGYRQSSAARSAATARENTAETKAKRLQYRKSDRGRAKRDQYTKSPEWKKRLSSYKKSLPQEKKLANILRSRLRLALRGEAKSGSAVRDLGCTIPELRAYLEAKFYRGMTWEAWGLGSGRWQIDHVVPFCQVDLADREQFLRVNHYTNLQPLWHEDHLRKTQNDIRGLSCQT